MHKIFVQIFFNLSILWGVGYFTIFRYPIYIYFAIFLLLTSRKIAFYKLRVLPFLVFPILMYGLIWSWYSTSYLLLILFYIFFVRSIINYSEDDNFEWVYKSIIFTLLATALSLFFIEPYSIYTNISSGLYPEPSHLGFTLGPAIGLITFKKKYRLFGIGAIIYFIIQCFSRSLIIGYFTSILLSINYDLKSRANRNALILTSFLAFIILSFYLYINFVVIQQIDNPSEISIRASSIIWSINIEKAISIMFSNPFGVGPFGWIKDGIENLFIFSNLDTYNQRDLASLAAYGIASFGWLSFIYAFYIFKWLFKDISLNGSSYKINPIALLTISYIVTSCFRWTGITVGPILGMLCLVSNYNIKKNDNEII